MTGRRVLVLVAATLLAAATAVLAGIAVAAFLGLDARAAEAETRTGTPFSWNGTLAAGKQVSIHGINGSVNARPASGRTLEVSATKTAKRGDPERVRIETHTYDGGVTFCVLPLDKNGKPTGSCSPDGSHYRTWNDDEDDQVQVNFEIAVPAGVHLEVGWVNGDVAANDLDGDLDLHTVNGSVVFSTKRTASAETVNGSIRGAIGATSWPGTLAFESVNGEVKIQLARATRASVRVDTVNGDIQADFPGEIEGEWGPQSFRGEIGGGGASRIRVETVNGSVSLRTGS